jgi:hydroxyacylglutathione hydrolase
MSTSLQQAKFIKKTWVVGPFQCNCRLLVCPSSGEAALVDPGDEAQKILSNLASVQLPNGKPVRVKYLLHTHGHLDHIAATREVKERLVSNAASASTLTSTSNAASASTSTLSAASTSTSKAPVIALHRGDEQLYQALQMQGEMFGFRYETPLPVDHYLEHEEELRIGQLKLNVIHNPGHSPGSVSFRLHEDSAIGVAETVLTGDTLFQGSVGRTDLWGANQDDMFRFIRERLLVLDGDTRVCPGHGPDSTIGIERKENPFLR